MDYSLLLCIEKRHTELQDGDRNTSVLVPDDNQLLSDIDSKTSQLLSTQEEEQKSKSSDNDIPKDRNMPYEQAHLNYINQTKSNSQISAESQ